MAEKQTAGRDRLGKIRKMSKPVQTGALKKAHEDPDS
jgi:hypothetical protein